MTPKTDNVTSTTKINNLTTTECAWLAGTTDVQSIL